MFSNDSPHLSFTHKNVAFMCCYVTKTELKRFQIPFNITNCQIKTHFDNINVH